MITLYREKHLNNMKLLIIFTNIFFLSLVFCKSKDSTKLINISFRIENSELLIYPLSIRFANNYEKSELIVNSIDIKRVDTTLDCNTPYVIRFQSEGVKSTTINFYSQTCNDTTIVISLNALEKRYDGIR